MPYDERLRALISCFEDASAWERTDDSDSVTDAIERAADGGIGELFYEHVGTRARLHLRMTKQEEQMMDAILDQPLDTHISKQGDEDTFTGLLSATHAAIAHRHASACVTVHRDPQLVATVTVPSDFQKKKVKEAVNALGRIAADIDRLHEDIRSVAENHRRRNV